MVESIRRRPTLAFFLLTYAFSWGLWKTFDQRYLAGDVWALPGLVFGMFGPGLAGLLVSAAVEPGPREGGRMQAVLAFVVAWVPATTFIALDQLLNEARPAVVATVLASAVAALAPALVAGSVFSTIPGVRRHLGSLVAPRGPARYYVLAPLLFAGIWVLGMAVSQALGWPVPRRTDPPAAARIGLVGAVALTFLYSTLPNALSEEVGWRGLALPRLQSRHSPLAASLILWPLWALWHAPAYLGGFAAQTPGDALAESVLMLPVAIVFTWLYNRTGGSLLAVALLHPAMNTATRYLPVTSGGLLVLLVLTAFFVVRDRMWRPLPAPDVSASSG